MTREEAVTILEENKPTVIFEDEDAQKRMADIWNALDMAIKALEQTSKYRKEAKRWKNKALEQKQVIDKIRAEIKALRPEPTAFDVIDGNPVKDAVWETLIEVDKILDKYKAESEDKE